MNFPMWSARKSSRKGAASDSRRAERHRTSLLSCDLGTVVDISTTGMQLRCESKPPLKVGQIFKAKLTSESQRLNVSGQVIWIKRRGLKAYSVGVQFVALTKSTAAVLESFGRFGFVDLDAVVARKVEQTKQTVRATVELPDYYKVLGIPRGASADQVQQAFRSLARQYHPDVADVPGANRKFIEISQAYAVLSDAHQRRVYDLRMAG